MAIKFKYTTGLMKIRQMKKRIKVIPGGSSAGKTICIIAILIDKAIKNPGLRVSVVSESMPHLKKGAIRDFLAIMKDTNRFIVANWNITNSIYTFTNGSYIEFFGVDTGIIGSRRDILYVNEANRITQEQYNQLAMRTEGSDIYLDYNPTHSFWINDVMEDETAEMLTLTYKDNEGLNENTINFLESKRVLALTSDYWKNYCSVYLDGLPGRLDGVIFNNWSQIDSIPFEAQLLGMGMDFGFTNDPSACIALYKWNGQVIIDEIFYRKGLSNGDISNLLKDSGLPLSTQIYADSAEPKSIAEISKYGHNIYATKKGPDSILAGIQILQEQPMLVTKRSRNLINELENYSWKKDNNGNSLNVPIDSHNHVIDGARYIAIIKLSKTQEYTPLVFM